MSFAGRTHGFVDEALARIGRERRVVLTLNQFSTAAQVMRQSDLLAVFPRSYVPVSGVAADLAIRALPFEMPRIEVGLLWHRRHERDPAHGWLRLNIARRAAEVARRPAVTETDAPATVSCP